MTTFNIPDVSTVKYGQLIKSSFFSGNTNLPFYHFLEIIMIRIIRLVITSVAN